MVLAELLAINNSASSLMWYMKDQWLAGCLATHTHTQSLFGALVLLHSARIKKKRPGGFISSPIKTNSILYLQAAIQAELSNVQLINLSN